MWGLSATWRGSGTVIKTFGGKLAGLLLVGLLIMVTAQARQQPQTAGGIQFKFVPLLADANAVIAEPAKKDPVRNGIAILIAHPGRLNTFNYFLGPQFAKRGYPTMMVNYYGRGQIYEEFLPPIAAAIRYLRSLPGVRTVVLAGHSSGGDELTFYQDVAENGAAACQGHDRIYPCKTGGVDGLPRADGMLVLDIFIGAPVRALAFDPAVNDEYPNVRVRDLDMFDPQNGFDPRTHTGRYSPKFVRRFYAAQQARNQRLLDEALARLAKITEGQAKFRDDEPFTVAGGSESINGARLDLADRGLLSHTRAPHLLLKADGSSSVEIIPSLLGGVATADDLDELYHTAQYVTVREYLSYYALRTTSDFRTTADDIKGIDWRSSADSAVGNIEGITVPTLVMAATCAAHLVTNEIVYDHSAAKDKRFVGVEGADHYFRPCRPEYGDTLKRTFDYVDTWLTQPGRFPVTKN
jgi:hypothetical protein